MQPTGTGYSSQGHCKLGVDRFAGGAKNKNHNGKCCGLNFVISSYATLHSASFNGSCLAIRRNRSKMNALGDPMHLMSRGKLSTHRVQVEQAVATDERNMHASSECGRTCTKWGLLFL